MKKIKEISEFFGDPEWKVLGYGSKDSHRNAKYSDARRMELQRRIERVEELYNRAYNAGFNAGQLDAINKIKL